MEYFTNGEKHFNFDPIKKGNFGFKGGIDGDVVRWNGRGITLSDGAVNKLGGTEVLPSGTTRACYDIAYDNVHQAFQLRPSATGWAFFKKTQNKSMHFNATKRFRETSAPTGDYVLVEGTHNIFQLAK